MKLYTFFRSSAAFRERLALNCKGLAYAPQVVSLPKDEHKLSSYLAVHPQGLVPQVFNAQRYQCDLAPYPTIMGIFAECMKLDAFINAQPSRQPDAA